MVTLQHVFKLNACTCIGFGLLFIILPGNIALYLSTSNPLPELVIQIAGVVLLVNGLELAWFSRLPHIKSLWVLYFSLGDFIWVVGSLSLILFSHWISTLPGIITTVLIAVLVGLLGSAQLALAPRERQPLPAS